MGRRSPHPPRRPSTYVSPRWGPSRHLESKNLSRRGDNPGPVTVSTARKIGVALGVDDPRSLGRGGRPEEVRHVPDNSGVSGRGVDNLALDALPTVPSSWPTGCRCTMALAGALVRVSGGGACRRSGCTVHPNAGAPASIMLTSGAAP